MRGMASAAAWSTVCIASAVLKVSVEAVTRESAAYSVRGGNTAALGWAAAALAGAADAWPAAGAPPLAIGAT